MYPCIQAEDQKAMENDQLDKQRAKESLESQMDRKQTEAKHTSLNNQRIQAFKDQVLILKKVHFLL